MRTQAFSPARSRFYVGAKLGRSWNPGFAPARGLLTFLAVYRGFRFIRSFISS
jgi:hypothetical protein